MHTAEAALFSLTTMHPRTLIFASIIVCLSESDLCEEQSPDQIAVPSLPKDTAKLYLYGTFHRIKTTALLSFFSTLRNGLTGNLIAQIEDGVFSTLPDFPCCPPPPPMLVRSNRKLNSLAHLYLRGNELTAVPRLPVGSLLIPFEFFFLQNKKMSTTTEERFCKGNLSGVRFIRLWSLPAGRYNGSIKTRALH
uniref:Uncharacterized protein n=1 Tax=Fundulus heteroclitus TaxID=8078 RepID=A0A3Q2Q8U1_FUNHE